ncbi:MAG: PQQ-binding-like beta-propeller repeat protein [Planctomycetes bacterium]|nr:PQQ-binding-like beta-propeller repeat protein [Planctomycetota bacterium]
MVVGAKDTNFAQALVLKSAYYVQILQPEVKLAMQWGEAISKAEFASREKLGVRDAAFDAEHYGSNLFNLVVVEDVAALGQAKLSDLIRILTPNGVLAFRQVSAPIESEAQARKWKAEAFAGYAAVYRKPIEAYEWKPADALKWRAGMRAHMAYGICGPTHGAGRFYYREGLESKGGWPNDTSQLVARDAYNGRVLWMKQEQVPFSAWRASQFAREEWSLAADETGRLFAVTIDGKLVCLDGATGEQRFVLIEKGAVPNYVRTWKDKYVLYGGSIFSAVDGKLLWKTSGKYLRLHEDMLLESDGAVLRIRKLEDGTEVLKADMSWRADRIKNGIALHHMGSHILVTEGGRWERPYVVTALNPATGAKVWSQELGGIFALPAQGKGVETFAGDVSYTKLGEKVLVYTCTPYFHEKGEKQKEVHFTKIDLASGKVEQEDYGPKGKLFGSTCNNGSARRLGDYLYYWHNVWLKLETFDRQFPFLVHPNCFLPSPAAYGMIYNAPGRKGGSIQGITAIGPTDITFDQEPGGKILVRYAPAPAGGEPTAPTDWPTFRGTNARGNATATDLGAKLEKAWDVQVSLGGKTHGQMYGERTGLTQATVAYGIAYVADIDAQRVVALDVKDGKQRWVHHLGSRADFPPTLYKGLCLVATKDGFVHALDAKTGAPVYKLLIAPRERYIGGQEKIESLWPTAADVMVGQDGVARASAGFASTIHGGNREVAFRPETGEVVEAKVNFEEFSDTGYPGPKNHTNIYTEPLAGGRRLASRAIDDMLGYGNSISRTNEDRAHEHFTDPGTVKGATSPRAGGRVIAFDEALCVAQFMTYGGQSWATKNPLHLVAVDKDPKQPMWKSEPIELVADDILLTPKYAFCVGHYRRVEGQPEIWIIAREDGKVVGKTPVSGFPAFFGMSASENRVFVSTREGKLICYEAK